MPTVLYDMFLINPSALFDGRDGLLLKETATGDDKSLVRFARRLASAFVTIRGEHTGLRYLRMCRWWKTRA